MRPFPKYAAMLAVVGAIAFLVVSCGNNKVAECNKILQIANKFPPATAIEDNNLIEIDPQKTLEKADRAEQKAQQMEYLEVKDEQLVEYKARLIGLFGAESNALRDAANAAIDAANIDNKSETASINASLKASDLYLKATNVYSEQILLVGDLTNYCMK